ncbi:DNA-directed RNA polymerase subunit delta [Psychrobacillus psychrodurans]|uniref:Probable DNA-directed RNA polymerase subunit delta n=1 Tax=Psychrobacillus psychrodurans TaxID=126157 RepID=A0A9X3R8A0_9BACI|nr:DNA-directed RNA polymerase subunit delta [Psychrobacillus psychrodurans]MCZ8532109.1 DNA-directed RNA polymerase subunit delta [Psychrobacillus psychrodurans]SFM25750.1 DNA-directed RNA polymerase subunit delta [Psychrobacillus psychrodurans]
MKFREMTTTQLQEESLIDLAFAILEDKKNSLTLKELFDDIQHYNGLTDEEMASRKPQFYTDMNIDGRFLAIAENQWGLREWYPVEQIEEESAPTVKVRKKKDKVVDDDLEDLDEDEIVFEEEFDEFVEDDDEDEDDDDEPVIEFVEEDIDEVIEEDLIDEDDDEFEIDEELDEEDEE